MRKHYWENIPRKSYLVKLHNTDIFCSYLNWNKKKIQKLFFSKAKYLLPKRGIFQGVPKIVCLLLQIVSSNIFVGILLLD